MRTERAYCSGCGHEVRLVFTDPAPHDGQANLRSNAQIVCLDYEEGCSTIRCLVTGKAGIVMGVRLAKSHLNNERFRVTHARCDGCGHVSDLEILDETYAMCTLCDSTNLWATKKLDDGSETTVTGL